MSIISEFCFNFKLYQQVHIFTPFSPFYLFNQILNDSETSRNSLASTSHDGQQTMDDRREYRWRWRSIRKRNRIVVDEDWIVVELMYTVFVLGWKNYCHVIVAPSAGFSGSSLESAQRRPDPSADWKSPNYNALLLHHSPFFPSLRQSEPNWSDSRKTIWRNHLFSTFQGHHFDRMSRNGTRRADQSRETQNS